MSYRYILEKYKGSNTRYNCPNCNGKKIFTRYIDIQTDAHLPEQYGKCNRENNCGYHLSPYQDGYSNDTYQEEKERMKPIIKPKPPTKNADIPLEIFNASISSKFYQDNQFMKNIIIQLGESLAVEKAKEYHIGTSKHWQGATVFWFVGHDDKPKAGQIKLFDETNHTVKQIINDKKESLTRWLHSALYAKLKEEKKPIPQWLNDYYQMETKVNCLFGEHLLKKYPEKPIALVEAPKTAVIASAYFPKYVWIATGSLSYLTEARCKALQSRKVVLFPDLNALGKWEEKALKSLAKYCKYTVNDFLEKNASKEDIEAGYDLADYLANLNMKPKTYQTPFIEDNDYIDSLFFDENGTLCTGTPSENYPAIFDSTAPYTSPKAKDFVKLAETAPNVLKLKEFLGLKII